MGEASEIEPNCQLNLFTSFLPNELPFHPDLVILQFLIVIPLPLALLLFQQRSSANHHRFHHFWPAPSLQLLYITCYTEPYCVQSAMLYSMWACTSPIFQCQLEKPQSDLLTWSGHWHYWDSNSHIWKHLDCEPRNGS